MKSRQNVKITHQIPGNFVIGNALVIKSIIRYDDDIYQIIGEARGEKLSVFFSSQGNVIEFTKNKDGSVSRYTNSINDNHELIFSKFGIIPPFMNKKSPSPVQSPQNSRLVQQNVKNLQLGTQTTIIIKAVEQYDDGRYVIHAQARAGNLMVTFDGNKVTTNSESRDVNSIKKAAKDIFSHYGFNPPFLNTPQQLHSPVAPAKVASPNHVAHFKAILPRGKSEQSSLTDEQFLRIDTKIRRLKEEIPDAFLKERKTEKLMALQDLIQKCETMSVEKALDAVLKDNKDKSGSVLKGFFRNETEELFNWLRENASKTNKGP